MGTKNLLYAILDDFVHNRCDSKTFNDKFSDVYYLEVDEDELTETERTCFKELLTFLERFSPYKEDLAKYNYYIDEKPIIKKATEVLNVLKEQI